MKKYVLLLIFLLIPIVFGENENGKIISGGNLLITDVDVKVDDITSRNLKYNDEITKIAYPSSTLTFYVEVFNNHTSLNMDDVEIVVTIDDLNLEKSQNELSIGSLNDKKFIIEFVLPPNADNRDYDILITVEGKQNITINKVEYLLDLIIEKKKENEGVSEVLDYSGQLKTINQSLNDLKNEIGSYFEPYTNCKVDNENIKNNLNDCNKNLENAVPYKAQYENCETIKQKEIDSRNEYESKFNNCSNSINTIYQPQIQKTKNNYILWGIIIVAIAIGIYLWNEKRKKPIGEQEEEELEQS